jgi:hypothetical protein
VIAWLAAGCYVGVSGSPHDDDGGGGETGAGSGHDDGSGDDGADPPATQCAEPSAAPGRLRRITHLEYNNTVRDLLGDTTAPADAFPIDERIGHFDANSLAPVGTLAVENYMRAAAELAATAVADLDALVGCDPVEIGETACAESFIETFGRRVFRRPLTSDERDALLQLHASESEAGFAAGIELVLQAMLQSPHFLYRPEFGVAGDDGAEVVPLTAFEVATRLSYFLWATTPDDALLDAAAAGELDELEGVVAHADRMLDDPRFDDAVSSFARQWLGTEHVVDFAKNPALFPEFGDLRESFYAETDAFVRGTFRRDGASLRDLLADHRTQGDEALAAFYGVAYPDGATGMVELVLDPEQRAGVLTHPAVLSVHARENQTSPILRGAFVRERLLCQPVPPPPPNVNDVPPDPDPDSTARERFEQHTADPTCAACHRLLDPIGFGFESYDAIGRFRTLDAGKPVDASGELIGTRDVDGTFDGAVELAHRLAGSEEVTDCFASLWVEFAIGRGPQDADECSVDAVSDHFAESDGNLRELLLAVIASDAFLLKGTSP